MTEQNAVLLEHSEYDISNTADLERELRVLEPRAATIDMTNVLYMDTTALRSLMRVGQDLTARGDGARITLKNANPSMLRIFDVVGLRHLFDIEQ